ncbi:AMP dependent CoA ligase, putative, partial [Ixodes scapularis]
KIHKDSVSRVQKIMMGGSVITKSLAKDVSETFHVESLIGCYGLTETIGLFLFSPVGQITYDSSGFLVAGSKVKITDLITGDLLDSHQNGEILAHSPHIMKGYYGHSKATDEALSDDGWLRTGTVS